MNTHVQVANADEVRLRVTFEADAAEIKVLAAQLLKLGDLWPTCDLARTLTEALRNLESRTIWIMGSGEQK